MDQLPLSTVNVIVYVPSSSWPERGPIPGIFKFTSDAALLFGIYSDFEYEIHIRERYFTTISELVAC